MAQQGWEMRENKQTMRREEGGVQKKPHINGCSQQLEGSKRFIFSNDEATCNIVHFFQ